MVADPNKVQYLDKDVLTAAKERTRWCLKNYDHVYVSFSGGKDSLATFVLLREVMDEMGIEGPAKAIFRDEEVIADDVINFVREYAEGKHEGYHVDYFCCPMISQTFVMGEHKSYVAWDPERGKEGRWLREPPPYAIMKIHPENKPLDQHLMNPWTFHTLGCKGRIGIINGIRADESLTRLRSCLLKKGEFNWIAGDPAGAKNIHFVKPIFDWSQADVFKYFYDRNIRYCPIYNLQVLAGDDLRVATPLHDRAITQLLRLRRMYPKFYEQILDLWPEVATHERYWKSVDRFGVIDRYPKSWTGIFQYIEDHIHNPANKNAALRAVRMARQSKEKNRRTGRYARGGCYGYPLLAVFKTIVGGAYMKNGVSVQPFPNDREVAFERAAEEEARG